jgi:hypothetical protein
MKKFLYLPFFMVMFLFSKNNAMSIEEQLRHPFLKDYIQDPTEHVNYPQCLFEALNFQSTNLVPLSQSCEKCRVLIALSIANSQRK